MNVGPLGHYTGSLESFGAPWKLFRDILCLLKKINSLGFLEKIRFWRFSTAPAESRGIPGIRQFLKNLYLKIFFRFYSRHCEWKMVVKNWKKFTNFQNPDILIEVVVCFFEDPKFWVYKDKYHFLILQKILFESLTLLSLILLGTLETWRWIRKTLGQ